MIMVVVEDEQVERASAIIYEAGNTGYPGDGRAFDTPIDAAYTLRTGQQGL